MTFLNSMLELLNPSVTDMNTVPNRTKTNTSYWTLVLTRNGQDTVQSTIESVIRQIIPPSNICIIDDGSTDSTNLILSNLKLKYPDILDIVTLPDKGYDIRRVAENINVGLNNQRNKEKRSEYIMISGDDCFYPSEYAKEILIRMDEDKGVVISSGDIEGNLKPDVTPRGSGRFIKASFLDIIGGYFPPYYGYEGWIFQKALQLGYSVKNYPEIRFRHLRELGRQHKFKDWGLAMKCLGYHPLEVLYRCIKYPIIDRRVSIGYLRILWDYLIQPLLEKGDPYYHFFEKDLRTYIWKKQKQRMFSRISEFFSFPKLHSSR